MSDVYSVHWVNFKMSVVKHPTRDMRDSQSVQGRASSVAFPILLNVGGDPDFDVRDHVSGSRRKASSHVKRPAEEEERGSVSGLAVGRAQRRSPDPQGRVQTAPPHTQT
ncbi:unnamed protein product [Boreogadus saida]